jgi:type 1 glutamine amidotransferase
MNYEVSIRTFVNELGRVATLALLMVAGLSAADDVQNFYFKKNTIRVLILSGRNNHDWRSSTPFMEKVLNDTGRFDVRVEEEPNGINADTLAPFDVLVDDYCGPRWGEVTEKAIEAFIRSGKGLVAVHAADYPFVGMVVLGANQSRTTITEPVWEEWKRIIGPFWLPITGHGARYTFKLKWTDPEHPILKGLDEDYYATDEFYTKFGYQPGVKVNVIATAYDDPKYRGTGKDEPVLMTLQYGKGRVFHTILGHDMTALVEPGFVVPFVRGTEWAATGAVTLPTPAQARAQAAANKSLRALVVTGGHAYNTSFYSVFDGYDDLAWDHAPSNEVAFRRDIRERYDVLVLYDYSLDLSEPGRKNLRDFLEAGKGVVVLHHAIADYNSWPWWWQEVVGGRYLLKANGELPASKFKEDVDVVVQPTSERSPITSAVGPMHVKDEVYKGLQISKDVKVLLTTDNPDADGPIAWISPYLKSRVVYIALGHGPEAHRYPAYRRLVKNAILWAGGRQTSSPAIGVKAK